MTNGEKYGLCARRTFLKKAWKSYCEFWDEELDFDVWFRRTRESCIAMQFDLWFEQEATD